MPKLLALLALLFFSTLTAPAHSETVTGTIYDFGPMQSFQSSDGTSGTIYDFGGIKSYSDNRGGTGTFYEFGNITTFQIQRPQPPTAVIPVPAPLWSPTPLRPATPRGSR